MTERLYLACCGKRVKGPLHGALARCEGKRKGRARPGFTVGEEGEHSGVLLFDGECQHHDLTRATRRQRKTALCRGHVGERSKYRAEPREFDSQPRAVRFIRNL